MIQCTFTASNVDMWPVFIARGFINQLLNWYMPILLGFIAVPPGGKCSSSSLRDPGGFRGDSWGYLVTVEVSPTHTLCVYSCTVGGLLLWQPFTLAFLPKYSYG